MFNTGDPDQQKNIQLDTKNMSEGKKLEDEEWKRYKIRIQPMVEKQKHKLL